MGNIPDRIRKSESCQTIATTENAIGTIRETRTRKAIKAFVLRKALEGVDQNASAAPKYYKMFADLGNPLGQHNYGFCLQNGTGVEQDLVEAARYFKMIPD
jgi:TPR repeat protein